MATSSDSPDQPLFSPGLLFSHDWKQLHSPRGLLDTTFKEVDPSASCYQTVTFPITNALQFETFVNGLGRCDTSASKNCPLQILSGYDSETSGDCPNKPLSAIVKMTYKVTHTLSETPSETLLSDDVIKELQDIEKQTVGDEVPKESIICFLKKFGSHFPRGVQRLGKCFMSIVVVNEQCNIDSLHQVAEEIFMIFHKYEASIPGSHEGIWYNLRDTLNCTAWSEEKRALLQSARLCVAHHGNNGTKMSFSEWRQNDSVCKPVKVDPLSDNIVSVWDLINQSQMKFQAYKKLSAVMKQEWKMSQESQHSAPAPFTTNDLNIPRIRWSNLLDDLEMKDYFPAKITLQNVRSVHIQKEEPVAKRDLPWNVLDQLMLLNSKCREEDISKFAKVTMGTKRSFKDRISLGQNMKSVDKAEVIPHPMDVTLLIFLSSDFMLRQVLAKKLFMCHLAIPFIVPTPEDSVEILLWPLRSIVMEWRNEQEAKEKMLVTSNLNIVAFMRFGQTKLSKSKFMNTVLSHSSHDTFCHKDTPCGNGKRQISNGTVEMSHYLPSNSKSDHFSQPALFFNLRGDACNYPVQHSLMMELATVLVILVDLQELQTKTVQELLCETVKTKHKVVVLLTDSNGHAEEELDTLLEGIRTLLGDSLKDIEVVNTFENGQERNRTDVIQEVRESITAMMVKNPPHSLEDFAALANTCPVDETAYRPCKAGKRVAGKILSATHMTAIHTRKQHLLPQQGLSLHETGKLLRKLHRSSGRDMSLDEKEDIKARLKEIKISHAAASNRSAFIQKIISMLHEHTEEREFAMRWVQMELDAATRSMLPELQSKKNHIWNAMMKAQDEKLGSVSSLEQEISSLEKQIEDATFGMEHIMREMGHLYDVAADLEQLQVDSEFDLSPLPDIVARLLLEGQPVELMDGDHGFIPMTWVQAVFLSLSTLVGDKKLFVLSVMGIQSSGKSTLLNTLFGLEFAVSAGRCTRGIYAQLLPVATGSGLPFDYMLVLDSEGLRAQELGQHNYEHDNELATLVIGLSDLALINMKGENVMEITDILQIVVLAFLRMKHVDSTHVTKCIFVHQNVSAVNAEEKLAVDRQKFQEQLNIMTQQASESQGLHQTVTSFNHVINFDGEQDVIYFSDLWHGDPPMAPVNQGYSTRASETRQRILTEVSQNCKTFLTISEFVVRVNDMWKGILTDDFIFNFRNSLAAKAYLDLEREFAKLTMEFEEDLLQWVNTTCNVQLLMCQTEPDVNSKCTELNSSLRERVSKLQAEQQTSLQKFFESHPARDVIMQWEAEKKISLQMFVETVLRRMHIKLDNIKVRRRIEIQQNHMCRSKEQAILAQAISLAETLRGQCPDEALQRKFDEIWNPWAEELIASSSHQPLNVKETLESVLWEKLTVIGDQRCLKAESEHIHVTTGALTEQITSHDLSQRHISARGVKENVFNMFSEAVQPFTRDHKYLEKVADQVNAMMAAVMKKVQSISQQDILFERHHGRQVIDFALEEVKEYNDQKHIPFAFTPEFRAMFVLRVVHFATPMFESMNQKFEEKHGVHTKLKHFKQRVFKQFQNAVHDASTEVTISDDFRETIKQALIDNVKLRIDQQVVKELHQALGITKYDLITKLLDDIVTTKEFSSVYTYVHTPVAYATQWLQTFGERLVFGEGDGKSRYVQFVRTYVEEIIAKVQASTQNATHSVMGSESVQYSKWISTFSDEIEESIALDTQQLEGTGAIVIKDVKHFQKCLDENLKNLEVSLKQDLGHTTTETVTWANDENPFKRVYERLWGCREICPLCKEPCQQTDPNHTTSHSCIQHRPSGMRGTKNVESSLLVTETCNMDVASECTINCAACSFECRKTPYCTATDEQVFHPYREYKIFLPSWDIAPDPSGEATKFWKWIMCTFKDQLLEKYKQRNNVAGVEIPESWNDITEQQARDSLREFFQ